MSTFGDNSEPSAVATRGLHHVREPPDSRPLPQVLEGEWRTARRLAVRQVVYCSVRQEVYSSVLISSQIRIFLCIQDPDNMDPVMHHS